MAWNYWWIIILASLAAVLTSIGLFPTLMTAKRRGRPSEDKLLDFEASTRNTIAQLCVGLTGFLVIYVALSNLRLADQQQIDAQFLQGIALVNKRRTTRPSAGLDGNGACSINGDTDVVGRVGGVFALESVVQRRPALNAPVLHLLAALVRREASKEVDVGPCRWLTANSDRHPYQAGRDHETLPADVEAAMAVIGRLAVSNGERIDLSRTNLCLSFTARALFQGTNLRDTDLRGAILDCADFENATLTGANLKGVHMPGVRLRSPWLDENTRFDEADLSCAEMVDIFDRATFRSTNLSHADLTAAKLSQEQLDSACGTGVKLPEGLHISPCKGDSIWASRFTPACSTSRAEFCRGLPR